MTRKPVDDKIKKNAFSVCLLGPINNSIYNSSYEIENLLGLLQRAKDEETFKKTLEILTRISDHQEVLARHFTEIVQSMVIDPKEKEKIH